MILAADVPDRRHLGAMIATRLRADSEALRREFRAPGRIGSCVVDDLLPAAWADALFAAFPRPAAMMGKRSLREDKYVTAQMDRQAPCLAEVIFAFQEPDVVAALAEITGIPDLAPDPHLYAGGLSVMTEGQFLNPHLDNSHDKDRARYRVLNLLYYVTPDWPEAAGGNLELWDDGLDQPQRTIHSRHNRLVVMVTDQHSWHSVSPIGGAAGRHRCCVSNYYFAPAPAAGEGYFHVTSFRGRPEQPWRDLLLRADAALRMGIRRLFPKGIRPNPHVYRPATGQAAADDPESGPPTA